MALAVPAEKAEPMALVPVEKAEQWLQFLL